MRGLPPICRMFISGVLCPSLRRKYSSQMSVSNVFIPERLRAQMAMTGDECRPLGLSCRFSNCEALDFYHASICSIYHIDGSPGHVPGSEPRPQTARRIQFLECVRCRR